MELGEVDSGVAEAHAASMRETRKRQWDMLDAVCFLEGITPQRLGELPIDMLQQMVVRSTGSTNIMPERLRAAAKEYAKSKAGD